MNTAPCRNCNERHIGCHARCDKYLAYVEKRKEIRKAEARYKATHDISLKCKAWLISEIKRKQRGH